MGHRLSKIYTRTGDAGTTGLGNGNRVSKDSLRIHTLGEVDETTAEDIDYALRQIADRPFDLKLEGLGTFGKNGKTSQTLVGVQYEIWW